MPCDRSYTSSHIVRCNGRRVRFINFDYTRRDYFAVPSTTRYNIVTRHCLVGSVPRTSETLSCCSDCGTDSMATDGRSFRSTLFSVFEIRQHTNDILCTPWHYTYTGIWLVGEKKFNISFAFCIHYANVYILILFSNVTVEYLSFQPNIIYVIFENHKNKNHLMINLTLMFLAKHTCMRPKCGREI